MKSVSFKEYRLGDGACPRCRSTEISGEMFNIDTDIASQNVECQNCFLMWTDEYTLTGLRSVYCMDTDQEFDVTE